jgi:hypothetical protein
MSVSEARQSVAGEVRAVMARKRISVSKAARALGVGQSWLHRRVVGDIPFDVGELYAVADLLETPVEQFFAATPSVSTEEGIRKTFFLRLVRDLRIRHRFRPVPARSLA